MRNSTLLPEAKHLIVPSGVVSTEWPSARATLADVDVFFDQWQEDLARLILAKDKSGAYATDIVGLSIARQVGKTYSVGSLIFQDCIRHPGTKVAWTAHRFKVARETFNDLRTLALKPRMRAHIDPDAITTGAGNETIPFRNGSVIGIASRDRGGLRGFAKVRRVVLDEGQILSEQAMADIIPTMNQGQNPQLIIMGTPPKPADESEVFQRLRRDALHGNPDNNLWVEYGAPVDADPMDEQAWALANPSFPKRTPAKAIRRLHRTLSLPDFRREALGIWDDDRRERVIPASLWDDSVASAPGDEVVRVLGVDMAPDRSALSIVGCVKHSGGVFFELVKYARAEDGFTWLVPWLAARKGKLGAVMVDSMSPATSFIPGLKDARVPLVVTRSQEMGMAYGMFMDGLASGRVTHTGGQAPMDAAVDNAETRPIGQAGGKGWDRRDKGVDISPLVAATLGVYGCETVKRRPGRKQTVSL